MIHVEFDGSRQPVGWPRMSRLKVVCAWCGRLLSAGDRGAETSHGACEVCAERLLHEDE